MYSRTLFVFAAACLMIGTITSAVAQAPQAPETRVTPTAQFAAVPTDAAELAIRRGEAIVVSEASAEDLKPLTTLTTRSSFSFNQLMSAAIDERLGARYRWGAEGPSAYDCSGFVWSIFHAAGIDFERISARSMWSRFAAPTEEEKYKFGTLVFFNNLGHVGVVVDERGFYHASRRYGVIYSTFSDYWLARLNGFRKVPNVPAMEGTGR